MCSSDLQVTMSATQLKQLVRRTRKDERERVAQETGAIPAVDVAHDGLAEDAAAGDLDASDYEDRIFPDPAELPGTAESERREEQDPGAAAPR